MSLTSSLFNGASGLDSMSLDLEVIGDNISNADTIGFQQSRADFEDQMSQNLSANSQVGLGTALQDVQKVMSQGSIISTGVSTDVALQGNGFFVLQGNSQGQTGQYYSRNGQFQIDQNGFLVSQGGLQVQGYQTDAAGNLTGQLGSLQVGSASSNPQATANVTMQANLDAGSTPIAGGFQVANATATSNYSTTTTVYDSLGIAHQVQVYFTEGSPGNWTWNAVTDGGGLTGGTSGTPQIIATGSLTFGTNGQLTASTQTSTFNPAGATNPQPLNFNFGTPTGTGGTGLDGITDFAGTSATTFLNQDGFGSGTLSGINVNPDGEIQGTFTNGQSRNLGQIAVAQFQASNQLIDEGGNLYGESGTSGQPVIGQAGAGGAATLTGGSLEQSNVDLSTQLVDMIGAQRNYQADAQTIQTADTMLQDLMQMAQQG